jgi:hypothetical protein
MDPRKNEERVINACDTLCWTDRIMNDEVLQRAKEERLHLKIL